MALKKKQTLVNGLSGEYWRIKTVSPNSSTRNVEVTLELFANETAKNEGVTQEKQSGRNDRVLETRILLMAADQTLIDYVKDWAYEKLKDGEFTSVTEKPDLSEAVDV